ncbi:AAA family ATPase [Aliiruegeria lutimaris]|uniref:AAA domain-containing protein n=1 Tax=Aliiruegeria lutimaris TaxID=571298 RepID=A0A1G8LT12_9RHOB|nr:AAA family ATPase [Aliiruegeria lutimaris]SDI58763.1 AAA domain-containing protein [Aliiruegeria lutimaris]
MAGNRIHIFGASGAGTTTLGRALASALESQHFDTDDFFWYPTDPPFQEKRPVPERRDLMEQVFLPRRDWVLSGSLDSWSEGIDYRFTFAVFLTLQTETRLRRLRARESWRLQDPAQMPEMEAFLSWAAAYDDGLLPGRNRARHLAWADTLDCPIMSLDSGRPVSILVHDILETLDQARTRP